MAKKQYLDLTGLTTYDEQIKSYIDAGDDAKAPAGHTHDDRYYTETEMDNKLSGKSNTDHKHAATDITSGTLSSDRLPTVPVAKGGTGATTEAAARTNLDVYSKSEVDTALSGKAASGHNHDSAYDTKGAASSAQAAAIASANSYTDGKISALLDGATDTTLDSIKELSDAIKENDSAIDALNDIAAGKAPATHSHAISDVTGLQSALNDKADSNHGAHVTFDSANKPKMDGTAAFGTSSNVARADHVHPTDTSRASQADLDTLETVVAGKADSGHTHAVATTSSAGFMSKDMVTKLNGIATGANKTTVDTAMSSTSENPVQNKVIYTELAKKATTTALDSVSSTASAAKSAAATNTQSIAANTSSINTHTSQITALQDLVGEGIEPIPTASITDLFE